MNELSAEQGKELVLRKKTNHEADDELVDIESKENAVCDTEAITKEEEWITKRKTELTTTRQIETRVKRQVVLEDGKVVEDTGPIVSTNTTEDTDKQETETTEKRDLGIPQDGILLEIKDAADIKQNNDDQQLAEIDDWNGKIVKRLVPRPSDGLIQESNDKRVISHEEKKDYLETEDVKHLGDITDEVYVQAVNSGVENLNEVLFSPESQQQLMPLGPRVVTNTSKSFKTIDTEDIAKRRLAQEDGKLVTESKKTTEHEVIVEKDLPDEEDAGSTATQENIKTKEATQRFFKQRDEQNVDLIVDNKIIDTEMRYAAETMQIEKEGSLERPGDWDSLSDRMRKLRRQPKTLMQQHKEAALLADRKDALTKRPLDFDREEETRKGETMKWLESHFGSESTASTDSRDDDPEIEPTKKTFFNVTIKSGQTNTPSTLNTHSKPVNVYDKKSSRDVQEPNDAAARSKYYHGITNWTDRKEEPANHFSTKAFRDDLQETVERNRLKKNGIYSTREQNNKSRYSGQHSSDDYVSREDILQQKRQSLSSQFLARTKRASYDKLNELNANEQREDARKLHHSRTDLRYGTDLVDDSHHSSLISQPPINPPLTNMRHENLIDMKDNDRNFKDNDYNPYRYSVQNSHLTKSYTHSPTPEHHPPPQPLSSTLGRPTVPQRRRAIERKLQQQNSAINTSPKNSVPLRYSENRQSFAEPPPDYSPPPRSRSSSPHADFLNQSRQQLDARERSHLNAINYDRTIKNGVSIETNNTLNKKQNQRTRFASTPPMMNGDNHTNTLEHRPLKPMMATQTTQTTPSTISTSTVTSHKSNRVGQVIGNSLRKLVNKIRSASAERKMRMKSKSKSREHSPTQPMMNKPEHLAESTTYQQYNVIDGHISGQPASNESEQESVRQEAIIITSKRDPILKAVERPSDMYRRANSADPFTANIPDTDQTMTPRQRYYLGEDPYSSTLYGKEYIYDPKSMPQTQFRNDRYFENPNLQQRKERDSMNDGNRREDTYYGEQRNVTSSTLGRYQKANRYAGSTPNLSQDFRTVQTLPRKLNDNQRHTQYSQHQQQYVKVPQKIQSNGHPTSISYGDRRQQYQSPAHNSGPAKPMRTYAKALNRSKSFNVHGMNGSNDPSPIYIEKLTKNNYNNNLHYSHAYKSNPHLNESSMGLKSPSIVNLISRSQKDLSKIGLSSDNGEDYYNDKNNDKLIRPTFKRDEKKQVFLKGLHQQAPELYKTLHGDEEYNVRGTPRQHLKAKHSLDSRPSVELNKDTASIIRRDNSGHMDSNLSPAYMTKPSDRKWGSGATIIEVRNIDNRK